MSVLEVIKVTTNPFHKIIYLPLTFRCCQKFWKNIFMFQLTSYLMDNSLFLTFQSAYCSRHSTETTLLHVFSDIVDAIDKGHKAIRMLLDLTAAFVTVDHNILLCLERSFGVSLNSIDLIVSYLTERTQSCTIIGDSALKSPFSMASHKDCTWSTSIYFIY